MKLTYQDVKARLLWSESNDLEFKPDFKEKYWQNDRIFNTIVAMANNEGGNIVIGINESQSKHKRVIIGTNHHTIQLSDKLHQLIHEYVDPMDLKVDVYPIEVKSKGNPKLIGIEIGNQARRFYAKRYYGRSTTKPSTYSLFLRINGQTISADFSTFINFVYGKANTNDRTLISEHFRNIKDTVIQQVIKLLESEPDRLPSLKDNTNYINQIDNELLKDLLENHYPEIKPLWTKMIELIEKRDTTDHEVNEIIETEIKNKLGEIGISYKVSMYDQQSSHINAVPIKEVTGRLRKLIENNIFDSEIEDKLSVEHHTRSSTINFYDKDGQHPDIYKLNEGERIKEDVEAIKNHLKEVFVKINSRNDIHKYIRHLNDLNRRFDNYNGKLYSALREIASKVELNIVSQCKYLRPGLG